MNISMLGIDIAKNTFQLHGANISGKAVHKKRLARSELAAHVANLPVCTIVMEACGGATYWARVFQSSGHTVKLISPQLFLVNHDRSYQRQLMEPGRRTVRPVPL
ncbi:MAG: transposase [Halieaceae bacterium]|jgi:transposase